MARCKRSAAVRAVAVFLIPIEKGFLTMCHFWHTVTTERSGCGIPDLFYPQGRSDAKGDERGARDECARAGLTGMALRARDHHAVLPEAQVSIERATAERAPGGELHQVHELRLAHDEPGLFDVGRQAPERQEHVNVPLLWRIARHALTREEFS